MYCSSGLEVCQAERLMQATRITTAPTCAEALSCRHVCLDASLDRAVRVRMPTWHAMAVLAYHRVQSLSFA